jgi:exodeoxyribonuclease VII large subunit
VDKFSDLDFQEESISVSQLNKLAKTLLENNIPVFWIKGEVSGLRNYNHAYFDLKDESGKISCVLFAKVLALIGFTLENGQQIEVRGKVTIYPQNGSYQINVERVRKLGIGELWEAYHRLLNKLRLEGLFDIQYKKTIPVFPHAIGVITSKEGSVIRDVITTLKRRMPNIPIVVYHTAVQGNDAGMQIVRAIRTANRRQETAVLIICRGGGSMEDLWCFNEEIVAREVFASQIPIISAVGHETDTTIIDFVADLRAPTPTGAAELVAKSRVEWVSVLNNLHYQLNSVLEYVLNDKKQQLDLYYTQLRYLNPLSKLRENKYLITTSQSRLVNGMRQKLNNYQMQLKFYQTKLECKKINLAPQYNHIKQLNDRLRLAMTHLMQSKNGQLSNWLKHLNLINPTNILSRGYAIVKTKQGKILYGSNQVKHHERIEILLQSDSISAIIDKKYQPQQEELI